MKDVVVTRIATCMIDAKSDLIGPAIGYWFMPVRFIFTVSFKTSNLGCSYYQYKLRYIGDRDSPVGELFATQLRSPRL